MMKRASDQPSPPLKHAKRDPSPPPVDFWPHETPRHNLNALKTLLNNIQGVKAQKLSEDNTLTNIYCAVTLSVDGTNRKLAVRDAFVEKARAEGARFFDVLKKAVHKDASYNDLEALIHHGMWHFYYAMNHFMNDLQMHF
jgi:hypothetical protein